MNDAPGCAAFWETHWLPPATEPPWEAPPGLIGLPTKKTL
jgi:hypothetical protein